MCRVCYVPSWLCAEFAMCRVVPQSFRYLLFSDKEEIIENVKIGDKLGASDHASIIFDVACAYQSIDTQQQRPNFYKANYRQIKTYLQSVDWA